MPPVIIAGGNPVPGTPTTAPSMHPLNLAGFFQRLSYGPLSNLAIGGDGSGTCDPAKLPALAGFANDGLLHLHSRFILKEKSLIIQMSELITQYKLIAENTRSMGSTDPLKILFIKDTTDDPFREDLIKVLQIFDDAGREIIMNDQSVYGSIFTPQFNVLQIPIPIEGLPLYISYQAKHVPLDSTQLAEIIDIPDVLVEALSSYVAHKVFFHMNGQDHSMKAKEHLDKFNSIVAEVLDKDLVNSSTSTNRLSKFHERGFR